MSECFRGFYDVLYHILHDHFENWFSTLSGANECDIANGSAGAARVINEICNQLKLYT